MSQDGKYSGTYQREGRILNRGTYPEKIRTGSKLFSLVDLRESRREIRMGLKVMATNRS